MFVVLFAIGNAPSDHAGASRAHYALPQPLHLKAVLKDHQGKSVAIRFEQVFQHHAVCVCMHAVYLVCAG